VKITLDTAELTEEAAQKVILHLGTCPASRPPGEPETPDDLHRPVPARHPFASGRG